jgi:PAS domain-containing protein
MKDLIEMWVGIFTAMTAVMGFIIANWKLWAKKAWNKWYVQYRANKDQWRNSITEVQKNMLIKLDKIEKQVYPNSGTSITDKVDQVLDTQAVIKEQTEAILYLDTTPIVKTNMKGEYIFANLAYLKLCGFHSFEEVKGIGGYNSVHPDDRERVKREYMEALITGNMFISTYRKVNISTKQEFTVRTMTRIVRDLKKPVEVIRVLQVL